MDFLRRHGASLAVGLGLGILAAFFLHQGHEQLNQARRIAGSTFRRPRGEIAQFHLFMALAGMSLGVILVRARQTARQVGALLGVVVVPVILLVVTWDRLLWSWLPTALHRRFSWVGNEVQAVAAVVVGMVVAIIAARRVAGIDQ